MNSKVFTGITILVTVATAAGIVFIEADKSKLRRQIISVRANDAKLTRAREDNRRSEHLVAQLKTDGEAGAKAIHADLLQARTDLAALEKKAAADYAKKLVEADATAQALADNRDPEKGMTKPEFLHDAGRATPAATLQTLIWAAMKGRESEMAACVAVESPAREKVQSFLDALPEVARAKYRTPEQLVALSFASAALESTAFQFAGSTFLDRDHASLAIRIQANGRERETKIPMLRDAEGWRMVVSERQIDGMLNRLKGEPPQK